MVQYVRQKLGCVLIIRFQFSYFVHFRDLKPDDAIRHIRALRPNSIETKDQEKTVIDYYNWLHGLKV